MSSETIDEHPFTRHKSSPITFPLKNYSVLTSAISAEV